jgi:hypothetical protein
LARFVEKEGFAGVAIAMMRVGGNDTGLNLGLKIKADTLSWMRLEIKDAMRS